MTDCLKDQPLSIPLQEEHYFQLAGLCLALWCTHSSYAQEDHLFDVETINVEDGLPHGILYKILQDKEGFIWVRTQGAISRHEGYNFKAYNAFFLTDL